MATTPSISIPQPMRKKNLLAIGNPAIFATPYKFSFKGTPSPPGRPARYTATFGGLQRARCGNFRNVRQSTSVLLRKFRRCPVHERIGVCPNLRGDMFRLNQMLNRSVTLFLIRCLAVGTLALRKCDRNCAYDCARALGTFLLLSPRTDDDPLDR
jgi:hypothetical protein